MIYFIQQGQNGPIKIGYSSTDDYRARLSLLQTGNPEELRVVGVVIDATQEDEFDLHCRFSDLHIRGEWFLPGAVLLQHIGVAMKPSRFSRPRVQRPQRQIIATEFLCGVEAYIAEANITPTFFGKKFANDPLFVFQLREGREPRSATRQKVIEAMESEQSAGEAA